MILIISILLAMIIIWQIFVKKDWISPNVFMSIIWLISTLFIWWNPYEVMKISDKSIMILFLGLMSFFIGNYRFFKVTIKFSNKKILNIKKRNSFNKITCYIMLFITLCFNLIMLIKILGLLKSGVDYSNIRDILFGYGENSVLFSSSFISTFYDWIIVPAISILLIILILNIFIKQLPMLFNILTCIDIIIYVFATSGRLLMMHAMFLLFFCYKFFNISIPKKIKKRVIIIGITIITLLLVMTHFRTKESNTVPTIYSYFSIDIPLLSYWIDYADVNSIMSYGNAFFRGILEGVNFLLGKVGMYTPQFWETQAVFNLIQNRWIEVFPGNWYNAYVSCFYYFYLDFGVIGVILESFIFGKITCFIYNTLKKYKSLLSIIIYMIIIQIIVDSFMRWQLGTLTYIIIIFLGMISIKLDKEERKYESR